MKILYHHRIASKDGQYVHVEEIVKALRKLGHQVIIVGPKVSENAEFGSDGGWVSQLRKHLPGAVSELLEFSYSFYVFLKLSIAILKHRPDGIYERYNLFLPSGIWAKKLFGLKLILEVNSPLYQERKSYQGIALDNLAKWSESYAWKNADHVLPVTKVLSGFIEDKGVPQDKITVVHNGIDRDTFQLSQSRNRDKLFKDKLTVGFVGFCREWHKLDEILALLAEEKDPDLMLLVIGDGPVKESLIEQAKQLRFEDNFHITGLISRQDMPHWLDQVDIAIQSAVTPWCSPLKLIEYLGKGKAIVAPDTDNIKELLLHRDNALLFDHSDNSNMVKCVRDILDDENLRVNLQKRAFETIDEKGLTWINNAKLISRLFANQPE